MTTPSNTPEFRKAKAKTAVYEAGLKVARAREALAKARDQRDATVALHVTTKPEVAEWYMHPGTITPEEAAAEADMTPKELHNAMARYRAKEKPKRAVKRASKKGAKARQAQALARQAQGRGTR